MISFNPILDSFSTSTLAIPNLLDSLSIFDFSPSRGASWSLARNLNDIWQRGNECSQLFWPAVKIGNPGKKGRLFRSVWRVPGVSTLSTQPAHADTRLEEMTMDKNLASASLPACNDRTAEALRLTFDHLSRRKPALSFCLGIVNRKIYRRKLRPIRSHGISNFDGENSWKWQVEKREERALMEF